nr:putative rna methyltransferase at5g10620 [Quercus suber]
MEENRRSTMVEFRRLEDSELERVVPIQILMVGEKRSPRVQLIVNEYIQKLNHYCTVDDVQLWSNRRNGRN